MERRLSQAIGVKLGAAGFQRVAMVKVAGIFHMPSACVGRAPHLPVGFAATRLAFRGRRRHTEYACYKTQPPPKAILRRRWFNPTCRKPLIPAAWARRRALKTRSST